MEIDLLDYLALKCGCSLLSDLHLVHLDRRKKRALLICVSHIPPGMCTLREWNDAVSYIIGKEKWFRDEAAAKEYLLHYLNANERLPACGI